MVKRYSFRTYSRYVYVVIALLVMMLCWETNKTNTALASAGIPQEAIRLRILANSDTVQDQAVKRLIRDEIVKEMNSWVNAPQSIEEARESVRAHLPVFRELIGRMLEERSFAYSFDVELGQADFPTKLYGSRVYPAGSYEALKVTLGGGEGQNWWCVLFPPLCFVDAASGEAVAKKDDSAKEPAGGSSAKVNKADKPANADKESDSQSFAVQQKQVRFFLWDTLQGMVTSIKHWF